MKKVYLLVVFVLLALLVVPVAAQEAEPGAKLVIESWRQDDIPIWNDVIIPAFNKIHPEIK